MRWARRMARCRGFRSRECSSAAILAGERCATDCEGSEECERERTGPRAKAPCSVARYRGLKPATTPKTRVLRKHALLLRKQIGRNFSAASVGRGHLFCISKSEEHTSELQSLRHLVCRLLL